MFTYLTLQNSQRLQSYHVLEDSFHLCQAVTGDGFREWTKGEPGLRAQGRGKLRKQ